MTVFKKRRETLIQRLDGALAVVRSRPEAVRNGDVHHPFRQESNLYYLTGFEEPEVALVLDPQGDKEQVLLFLRPRDPKLETWNGRRLGLDRAIEALGVDKAYDISELETKLAQLCKKRSTLYATPGLDQGFDDWLFAQLQAGMSSRQRTGDGISSLKDLGELVSEMRMFKGPEEVEAMVQAARITKAGHEACIRGVRPGMHEFELEALLAFHYRQNGSPRDGYPPIVAAGDNATILHYVENNAEIKDGDLILIDSGAEVDYYTADVTRTFPANGKFTAPQRDLYNLVLESQKQAIAMVKPGSRFQDVHQAALDVLVDGMLDMKMLGSNGDCPSRDQVMEKELYNRFYMHKTSHWIGMDVHDVGTYAKQGNSRVLEPGMALTVEPGIYIPENDDLAPEAFRGIGIRIENDVVVTEDGVNDLSIDIIREVEEIEALHDS